MRLKETSVFSAINLAEGARVPNEVQVLRVGKFNHPRYGAFEITTQTLTEMKFNFDKKVRGIDTAFDYFHDSDKEASAWVNDLLLKEDGTELWAAVTWTPQAEKKLAERELRYFSPDFAFQWQDPESGQTFNNVLFGGGLTNRPFVKEMQAIVADETKTGEMNMTELEKAQKEITDLKAQNVKLSEDKAAMEKKMADMPPAPAAKEEGDEVAALKKQIADLQAQLAKAQQDSEMAMAEKKKADEAKMLAEKTSQFNVLLSEGKACAAQKEAFLKGDMDNFVKLSQPLNMKASGSSSSATVEEADAAAIIKLAEEKQKSDKKLSRADAISIAKKELKK
jgi:hypothetical protein